VADRCFFFNYLFRAQFHQYQVVGRALPTPGDEHPKIYRMKLWATNEVRAKSKFWSVPYPLVPGFSTAFSVRISDDRSCLFLRRYFLRKLKKVKKSNGQMLAINEVQLVHIFGYTFCNGVHRMI